MSEWIHVYNDLPDVGIPVLVYCQYSEDAEYELDIALRTEYFTFESTTTGATVDVLYWFLIPKLPEVKP